MELIIKLLISVFVIFICAKALHWTWSSHIDPKATLHKYINKDPAVAEIVVTRDPNKLYQGGGAVADITGNVTTTDTGLIFEQIANTTGLDTNNTIEYQRDAYRIVKIESMIGMKSVVSNTGSSILQNVMENVVCEKVN